MDTTKDAQISKITIFNSKMQPASKIPVSENFFIRSEFTVFKPLSKTMLSYTFYDQGEILLLASPSDKTVHVDDLEPGKYAVTVEVPAFLFNTGIFFFDANIHKPMIISFDHRRNLAFEITDEKNPRSIIFGGNSQGKIASILEFKTERLKDY